MRAKFFIALIEFSFCSQKEKKIPHFGRGQARKNLKNSFAVCGKYLIYFFCVCVCEREREEICSASPLSRPNQRRQRALTAFTSERLEKKVRNFRQ